MTPFIGWIPRQEFVVGVVTGSETWQMLPQYPIRLVVLDERPIVRTGIVACLRGEADLDLIGDFDTLRGGMQRCEQAHVVLLGHQRHVSVAEVIGDLSRANDKLRFVVLSNCGGDARARLAFEAGAQGFMLVSASPGDLIEGIRVVVRGQRFLDNATAIAMANGSGDDDLRPKEIEVLQLVAAGRANKQIAFELSTTEGTVKNHIKRILAKLDAADRTHAVVIAARRGFIDVHQ